MYKNIFVFIFYLQKRLWLGKPEALTICLIMWILVIYKRITLNYYMDVENVIIECFYLEFLFVFNISIYMYTVY